MAYVARMFTSNLFLPGVPALLLIVEEVELSVIYLHFVHLI